MKLYMYMLMLGSGSFLQAADKRKHLLQADEIDYSQWKLHRSNKEGGIHVEKFCLIDDPLPIPQQPLIFRLFACCCTKKLNEKHARRYQDAYSFTYNHSTNTIQRFYPYRSE